MDHEEDRKRVIQVAEDRGELIKDGDGFFYFWPKEKGSLTSYHLRWLADELDRRNKPWQEQIDKDFNRNFLEVGFKVMIMGGEPKARGDIGVVKSFMEGDDTHCYVESPNGEFLFKTDDLQRVYEK